MTLPEIPRLRPVDAFPVAVEGRRVVCLQDPSSLTESVLFLPPSLFEIVALFDGQNSVVDIQAAYMRRHGQLLFREKIEEIIRTLDEHLFLDSPHFQEARARLEEEFHSSPVRRAAHAGKAYAGEAEALRQQIGGLFTHADGPGEPGPPGRGRPVRAVVAPHIDFHRGGPTYAWAYRAVAEAGPADCYVVLGTCHAGMEGTYALTLKAYDTPLGAAEVDREFAEALVRRYGDDLSRGEVAHRGEHSIEFQAVMLNYCFQSDVRIVPILCGPLHDAVQAGKPPESDPEVVRFVDALRETLDASRNRVCLVASADLAHVGPRFGDPEPVSDRYLREVAREDLAMLEPVKAGDARGFFDAVAKDRDRRRICGLSAIYTLLAALEEGQGELLKYAQWQDPQGAVTFASLAFV